MGICCVYGCSHQTHQKQKSGISFHRFPRNETLKLQWIRAVRRENWQPTRYTVICSEHFLEKFINRTSACGRVELREEAIPTIFPSYPPHLQPLNQMINEETPPSHRSNIKIASKRNGPTEIKGEKAKRNKLIEMAYKRLKMPFSSAEIIAKGWGVEYAQMTSNQQLFAKKAIDDILFEGRLGTLHRHSVTVNNNCCPHAFASPLPSSTCSLESFPNADYPNQHSAVHSPNSYSHESLPTSQTNPNSSLCSSLSSPILQVPNQIPFIPIKEEPTDYNEGV